MSAKVITSSPDNRGAAAWTGYCCLACGQTQPPDYPGYGCAACGQHLELTYDWQQVRAQLEPGRAGTGARADIFRYLPWLPLPDARHAPGQRVGQTPLYAVPHLAGTTPGLDGVGLFLKDDGLNPSASFKDRAGAVVLARARQLDVPVIAGASTGNAGSSLACLTAGGTPPCVIFVPAAAPVAKLTQLLIFGARVVAVEGSYDQAYELCAQVCARRGWYNRNTGYNPFTREGKKTASLEIWEQLGGALPDWVVVSVGDGNILSGVWKGFRELRAAGLADRTPRLLAVQAMGSAALAHAFERVRAQSTPPDWSQVAIAPVAATSVADSICVDQPRDGLAALRALVESDGVAACVSDADILAAMAELARQSGVFAEPAAAAAWAGLRQAAGRGLFRPGERVVCLLTGNGLKDVSAARRVAGEPVRVAPELGAVERRLDRLGL